MQKLFNGLFVSPFAVAFTPCNKLKARHRFTCDKTALCLFTHGRAPLLDHGHTLHSLGQSLAVALHQIRKVCRRCHVSRHAIDLSLQRWAHSLGLAKLALLLARLVGRVVIKQCFLCGLTGALGKSFDMLHRHSVFGHMVKARLVDHHNHFLKIAHKAVSFQSRQCIKHKLLVFLSVNANTHAVFKVDHIKGVFSKHDGVGCAKAVRNPDAFGKL